MSSARRAMGSEAARATPARRRDDGVAPPSSRASGLGGAALVGRSREFDHLVQLYRRAVDGGARSILIGGEAGVGKTSLSTTFARLTAETEDAVVIRGDCVPLGGEGLPYAPILGLVHGLVDRFGAEQVLQWADAGATELRWLVPGLGDPEIPVDDSRPQHRLRLYETIVRLVEQAARRNPLVILVEDLHWADDSSRHAIDFMVRALSDEPVMLILTYRTDELTRRHPLRPFLAEVGRLATVDRMEIGPLDDVAMTELIKDAEPELIKHVVRASGGIPFFAVELVRASTSVGRDLPETLRDTLLLRISRVGESAQRLLRLLAVGGNRVEHEVIAAVAELPADDLEMILREAVEANLLVPDRTGYAFRHALLREVLRDDLLPGEQNRLHRAYATALENRPELLPDAVRAVELALHWYAARDNTAAFRWSVQAARLQRYAFAEALQHYERALELWDSVPDAEAIAGPMVQLLDAAAAAAGDAGELDRSLALLDEALRRTDLDTDPLAAADRLSEKGRLLQSLMQPGALEAMNRAVELVPADPPTRRRADVLTMRAGILMQLDKPRSIEAARAAIAACQEVGATWLESHARNTLGVGLVDLGIDVDGGLAELRRSGELATGNEVVQLRQIINLSDTLGMLGRYRESVDVAVSGRELAAAYGRERRVGVMMAGNAAESAMALGEWARARELIEWALRLNPPGNHWLHLRRLLAEVRIWVDDDPDGAEAILGDRGRHPKLNLHGAQYFAPLRRTEAVLALATGDPVTAWMIIIDMLARMPWDEIGHTLPAVGVAAMAYGRADHDHQQQWTATVHGRIEVDGSTPISRQWLPLIRAELEAAASTDPVAVWQQALPTMITEGTPPHMIGYGWLRLAEAQVAAGDHEAARESGRRCAELADRMGLRLLQRWLSAVPTLAPVDGTDQHRTESATDQELAGLTVREREVLALVAEGLSNKQIGVRLVISTKTASVHVSNILAKLGVSTRGEAAARFRR